MIRHPISRRRFVLGALAGGGAAALLSACGQAAAPTPTTAPSKPAEAPKPAEPTKPAAAAPTAAPTTAPAAAAAKPTEAPKPAEPTKPAAAAPTPAAAKPAGAPAGPPVPALLRAGSGEEDFFNKAIELFEQQNPTVKVTRIFVPGGNEYITKLDLMIASGDPPAIYAPFSDRGYRYYAAKGLSQELDSFIKRDNVKLDDFSPDSLVGCKWKGVMMAFPLDYWPYVTFYNRNMFKAAGLDDLPTDWDDKNWTTDKYQELAVKLTKKSGEQVTEFGSSVYQSGWPSGRIFGGDWFASDVYDTGIAANWTGDSDARVAPSVQWSADLINKLHVSPSPAQQQQIQAGAPNLFMSGKVGMQVSDIGSLDRFSKLKDFDFGVGVAPQPPKGEKRRQHVWIDFWSMIKGTKNVEGSWQLMKFMIGPEGQRIYPVQFGPLSSLLSLGSYWAEVQGKKFPKLSAKEFKVITDGPKHEVLDLENWTVNFSPINDQVIKPGLDKVFLGQQTAVDAIKDMTPKVKKLVEETKSV
ncbi:MAG TPA: sugar ABC transporter substrate-binding protein [Chloroflexota bacterium]|jgi:multiple sugar transport system substrate-binding protein|nr:sugar ABC transporter substrate-binding protein [Chloroflexota bacterium]